LTFRNYSFDHRQIHIHCDYLGYFSRNARGQCEILARPALARHGITGKPLNACFSRFPAESEPTAFG